MRELLETEPGTYVLTDFLVRTFRRTVIAELGLDRFPSPGRSLTSATTAAREFQALVSPAHQRLATNSGSSFSGIRRGWRVSTNPTTNDPVARMTGARCHGSV